MKKERRIFAILKGKIESCIIKNRVKAFTNALEAAKINSELELQTVENKCIEAIKNLDTKAPSEVVQEVYNFVTKRHEIQEGVKMLQEVEKYINEEVEIDE